ncbi:lasso peptide biosynthesis B2 protein [Streptomyces sp. NPDC059003]|uniref:lasso peptide biosynthesis B2 protein n=1 Tax=Streptomyces sp. NPDC059003 TaxID=3346691 RepID=UPI00369F9FB1
MSIPMTLPQEGLTRPAPAELVVALAAFGVASALVHASPLRVTLALVRGLKRTTRRAAGRAEAGRIAAACTFAARYVPGRAACMERSLAVFLACCAGGARVDWCLGCRFDPCEAHAWVETGGVPVGEPERLDRPLHVTVRV